MLVGRVLLPWFITGWKNVVHADGGRADVGTGLIQYDLQE